SCCDTKLHVSRANPLYLLMLRCGLRVSEVARLTPADLDWDQQSLRITQGKGRKDRIVFVAADALAALRTCAGIRMKLSIDNCCKFNGFMLLSQTRAEYLCCCASFSRRLGRQTFCGGTGTGEKAAECQLGLKDHLHPAIGQSLEMSDEFEQAQFTFLLQPQGMTHLWTQRIIEQNEQHASIEIT